jgi:beta-glucosidase
MPWLSKTAAVMEAWYPGARGAEAITAVLFGDANPSGRLPITFPASETQLPRVALPGADSVEPNFIGNGKPGQTLDINYNVEGADVGYRWYARTAQTPLFAFGHGLSYSTFHTTALKARAGKSLWVECTVHNTGDRSGDDVVQIYLTSAAGTQLRRLIGYQRVALLAGETKTVSLDVDLRLLARWEQGGWHIAAGTYGVAVGRSAADPGESVDVQLAERRWRDIRTPH